jgi:hypothetical protein
MTQSVNIKFPFEQLLDAIEHLDAKERDLLRDRLIQQEEMALVRQAEQAANEFKLPGLLAPLSYWSMEKVLAELSRKLEVYEQKFGTDSRTFYLAFKGNQEGGNAEEAEWAHLYRTYQQLKAAKRRVDIKAGRVVEPLPVGKIISKQLTLTEIEERLSQFEQQHGMSSTEFYQSFKQGKQGDSLETFEWVHIYTAYITMTDNNHSKVSEDV